MMFYAWGLFLFNSFEARADFGVLPRSLTAGGETQSILVGILGALQSFISHAMSALSEGSFFWSHPLVAAGLGIPFLIATASLINKCVPAAIRVVVWKIVYSYVMTQDALSLGIAFLAADHAARDMRPARKHVAAAALDCSALILLAWMPLAGCIVDDRHRWCKHQRPRLCFAGILAAVARSLRGWAIDSEAFHGGTDADTTDAWIAFVGLQFVVCDLLLELLAWPAWAAVHAWVAAQIDAVILTLLPLTITAWQCCYAIKRHIAEIGFRIAQESASLIHRGMSSVAYKTQVFVWATTRIVSDSMARILTFACAALCPLMDCTARCVRKAIQVTQSGFIGLAHNLQKLLDSVRHVLLDTAHLVKALTFRVFLPFVQAMQEYVCFAAGLAWGGLGTFAQNIRAVFNACVANARDVIARVSCAVRIIFQPIAKALTRVVHILAELARNWLVTSAQCIQMLAKTVVQCVRDMGAHMEVLQRRLVSPLIQSMIRVAHCLAEHTHSWLVTAASCVQVITDFTFQLIRDMSVCLEVLLLRLVCTVTHDIAWYATKTMELTRLGLSMAAQKVQGFANVVLQLEQDVFALMLDFVNRAIGPVAHWIVWCAQCAAKLASTVLSGVAKTLHCFAALLGSSALELLETLKRKMLYPVLRVFLQCCGDVAKLAQNLLPIIYLKAQAAIHVASFVMHRIILLWAHFVHNIFHQIMNVMECMSIHRRNLTLWMKGIVEPLVRRITYQVHHVVDILRRTFATAVQTIKRCMASAWCRTCSISRHVMLHAHGIAMCVYPTVVRIRRFTFESLTSIWCLVCGILIGQHAAVTDWRSAVLLGYASLGCVVVGLILAGRTLRRHCLWPMDKVGRALESAGAVFFSYVDLLLMDVIQKALPMLCRIVKHVLDAMLRALQLPIRAVGDLLLLMWRYVLQPSWNVAVHIWSYPTVWWAMSASGLVIAYRIHSGQISLEPIHAFSSAMHGIVRVVALRVTDQTRVLLHIAGKARWEASMPAGVGVVVNTLVARPLAVLISPVFGACCGGVFIMAAWTTRILHREFNFSLDERVALTVRFGRSAFRMLFSVVTAFAVMLNMNTMFLRNALKWVGIPSSLLYVCASLVCQLKEIRSWRLTADLRRSVGCGHQDTSAPKCDTDTCTVCLEPFSSIKNRSDLPEDMTTLRCGHAFHITCADAWFKQCGSRPTCPLCRERIDARGILRQKLF